jgi:hypothetical protein
LAESNPGRKVTIAAVHSREGMGIGCVINYPGEIVEKRWACGKLVTQYQGLALAFKWALDEIGKEGWRSMVLIAPPSLVKRLSQCKIIDKVIKDLRLRLQALGKTKKVSYIEDGKIKEKSIEWKEAVIIAREAAHLPAVPEMKALKITADMKKRVLKDWARKMQNRLLQDSEDCRVSRYLIPKPGKNKAAVLMGKTRAVVRTLVGVYTGHCGLNRFLFVTNRRDNSICEKCDTGEQEDAIHFLCQCPGYKEIRERILGSQIISEDGIKSTRMNKIEKFISSSGRLNVEEEEEE